MVYTLYQMRAIREDVKQRIAEAKAKLAGLTERVDALELEVEEARTTGNISNYRKAKNELERVKEEQEVCSSFIANNKFNNGALSNEDLADSWKAISAEQIKKTEKQRKALDDALTAYITAIEDYFTAIEPCLYEYREFYNFIPGTYQAGNYKTYINGVQPTEFLTTLDFDMRRRLFELSEKAPFIFKLIDNFAIAEDFFGHIYDYEMSTNKK